MLFLEKKKKITRMMQKKDKKLDWNKFYQKILHCGK